MVGFAFDLGAGVADGDGETGGAHGGQVNDVVADEGGFVKFESGQGDDFLEAATLVSDALLDEVKFEVAGAQSDGFGDAFGDETCSNAAETGQRDGGAVVGVETFGLDEALHFSVRAVQAVATQSAVLGGLFFFYSIQHALFRPGRSREDEELAVGEHAVHVEEEKFDFLGAGGGGKAFGHLRDFSIPGSYNIFMLFIPVLARLMTYVCEL